ncbi:hypothetical protein KCP74_24455 [Salmonella enterica subsp. enterica]|nr:hypothetical protein KCP74_24455 [Salmonella enterica subsp. enterica]
MNWNLAETKSPPRRPSAITDCAADRHAFARHASLFPQFAPAFSFA